MQMIGATMRLRLYLRMLTDPRFLRTALTRPNPIRPWDDDPAFSKLMKPISSRTLVDPVRCFLLYKLALQCRKIGGDVAEVGVYRGGTARLLAEAFGQTKKTIHLFDTFSGMPPADPKKDWHRRGDFDDTSLTSVRSFLMDYSSVRLHAGLFPQTAASLETGSTFSFVHVDVDIYQSVLDSCCFFYPRLERGGVMVFDDYGFLTCPGAKLAVDEFFQENPEEPCYLPTGQCLVIKI